MGARRTVALLGLVAGCSSSADDSSTTTPKGCGAGEVTRDDGTCVRAGIAPDACGDVMRPDADGCEPILPPGECADFEIGVPGDAACRPIADCGAGPWPDVPDGAYTLYVDASYAGTATSDGSKERPYKAIQPALDAVGANGVVAVAAGSYVEKVRVRSRGVKLLGRCPSMVEVSAPDANASIALYGDATEVHGVSVHGQDMGIVVQDAANAVVDRVRVHDTPTLGIFVSSTTTTRTASAKITGVVVDRATAVGILAQGAEMTVEGSLVREVHTLASERQGHGIGTRVSTTTGKRSKSTIRRCRVLHALQGGVIANSADMTVEDTVIDDTLPNADGIARSLGGFAVEGYKPGSTVDAHRVAVRRNHDYGVIIWGADAKLEALDVRGVEYTEGDGAVGVEVAYDSLSGVGANVEIHGALVEGVKGVGVVVDQAETTLDGVRIRGMLPNKFGDYGRGLQVQSVSHVTSTSCAIDGVKDIGVVVDDSIADFDRLLVTGTQPRDSDGKFGDGMAVVSFTAGATITVHASRIASNARAGIASFGGTLQLTDTTIADNVIQLDGESYGGNAFSFTDGGGNVCMRGATSEKCQVLTSELAPPVQQPKK